MSMAERRGQVEILGQRRTGAIVRSLLSSGPARFSEITDDIPGLSDRLLWERLTALQANGTVEQLEVNRRNKLYRLTRKGEALTPIVRAVCDWADVWMPAKDQASSAA